MFNVFSMVKLHSTRCPYKMLRDLGGTTLLENHLRLLASLKFCRQVTLLANDPEVIQAAAKYKHIHVIHRSEESKCSPHFSDMVQGAIDYAEAGDDGVIWINPCCPFLRPDTIFDAVRKFRVAEGGAQGLLVPYYATPHPVWDAEGKSLGRREYPHEPEFTQRILSHAFWIRTIDAMQRATNPPRECGAYAEQHVSPVLFNLESQVERIDVDTEEDFLIAQAVWKHLSLNTCTQMPPAP